MGWGQANCYSHLTLDPLRLGVLMGVCSLSPGEEWPSLGSMDSEGDKERPHPFFSALEPSRVSLVPSLVTTEV